MSLFYRSKFLSHALTVLLLSGCAQMPDLGNLLPMRDVSFFESSKSISGEKSEWPSDEWWKNYNDPQLDNLIAQALQDSPSIEQAAARTRMADAMSQQASSSLYPNVSGSASLQKVKQSYYNGAPADFVPHGFQEAARASIDLNYQLDFWGRNRASVQSAISERKAAQLDEAQAVLSLSTAIAENYAQLSALYAAQDTAQDALDVRSKTAGLFKDRLDNGLENSGTYDQQLSAKAEAEAQIEEIKENIALTKNRLAALAGQGPDRAVSIERPAINNVKATNLPDTVPAELIGRRPDILAAKYRALAAAKRIKVAQADFYPNINLAAYFGQQSLGLDLFTKHGSAIGAFGPALSLPIFNGGRLAGQYKQAGAEYDLSVAQYNETIIRALNEIADAATSRKALSLREAKIRKAVAASDRAYQVALNRYKGGLSPYLDVLRAEDSVIANRQSLSEIKSRAFLLDVAMIRALGGGFQEQSK